MVAMLTRFRRSRVATDAADSASPRPAIPQQLWVLIGAAFLIAIGFGLVAPVLPQYAASFDVGMAAATAVVSVFSLARLVFAPAGGRLINHWGERSMYIVGLIIVALSSFATAAAQNYVQLLIFRGLGGIGSTLFSVSAVGLLTRMAPSGARGRVMSAYASAFLVGNIVGPVLGGVLAEFGMTLPFIIYGFSLLLAALVVWARLDGPLSPERRAMRAAPAAGTVVESGAETTAKAGSSPPDTAPLTFHEAVRDSAYRSALIGGVAMGWGVFGARVAILPLFVAQLPDARPSSVGTAVALYAGGNILAQQFSGAWSDRVGRKPVIISGLLVSGVTTGTLGLFSGLAAIFLLSVVAGFGAGLFNPAQQASVSDVVGNERSGGAVLAGFQMATDCGTIAGPLLVGIIVDQAGFGWGYAVCGLLLLSAALCWLPSREPAPPPA